jgi:hypothetical protein
MGRGGGG